MLVLVFSQTQPPKGQQEGWTARLGPTTPICGLWAQECRQEDPHPHENARFKILDLVKKPVPEIY